MREGTPRLSGLRSWASGLLFPLGAIVGALVIGGFTDAHATNRGRIVKFVGATSQHSGSYGDQRLPSDAVAFTYTDGRLRHFSIPWVATCVGTEGGSSPSLLDRIEFLNPVTVKQGSFNINGTYDLAPGRNQTAMVSVSLRGTIRGSRASGTIEISTQVDWAGKHYAPNRWAYHPDNVADCDTTTTQPCFAPARPCPKPKVHWSAVATGKGANLAFPALARPQAPPQILADVMFARTDAATGTSSLYSTWRDGPPSQRVTRQPSPASDSRPTTAPRHALVAFQRTIDGTSQIFANVIRLGVNVDGLPYAGLTPPAGAATQLTSFPAGAGDPAVSPNGQDVAFSVGKGADCSLWLMDQVGQAQRQLTNHTAGPGCDAQPAWSPDGNFIVFRRTQIQGPGRGTAVTYMMVPATGGPPKRLDLPAAVTGLSWAPANKLLFISADGSKKLAALRTASPNGGDEHTILRARGLTGRPAWSPGGGTIAFAQRESDGTTDIATVPASGGTVTDITETPHASESDPVWALPFYFVKAESVTTPLHVKSRPRRKRHK